MVENRKDLGRMPVNDTMLIEAEQAYHALLMGQAVARLRDQNGEIIEYQKADASKLRAYIEEMKHQLGTPPANVGPMRVWF